MSIPCLLNLNLQSITQSLFCSDEPFGLVAVEFGRKGALGVGSRLGGLGLMPGWWFPVSRECIEYLMALDNHTDSSSAIPGGE